METNAKKLLRSLFGLLAEPFTILALVFISTTAIAQPFYVPSGSMEPTLQIGDALIGSKFPYGYSRYSMPFGAGPQSHTRLFGSFPRRGDVVVFRLPRDPAITYVKRVIGLPGDRVQMRQGRLFLNGRQVPLTPAGSAPDEAPNGDGVISARFTEALPGGVRHPIFKWGWDGPLDNTETFLVPAGHLFMMGDNRDNSLDSRVAAADGGVGYVPMEDLVARADLIVGSYDFLNMRGVAGWPGLLRLSRFFHQVI